MIKKILVAVLITFCFINMMAQKLTIESFEQTTDAIARTRNVKGTDGNVCAAVVVRIPSANATFDGGFILGRTPYKNGEYILDMQTGAAQMRVSVPGFNTIDVKFRDYIGSTLQSKTTYLLTINMPQAGTSPQKMQTLNIKVTPSNAMVLIDDEMVESMSINLSVGSHKYNVVAKGYESQSGTVDVPENRPGKLVVELDRKVSSQSSTQVATVAPQVQPQSQSEPQIQQSNQQQIIVNAFVPQTFTIDGVSFTMIPVEGGTFTMGATLEMINPSDDEKPTHKVTLSSYYIGETEVTQALWQAVMGSNPSSFKGDQNPVEKVRWNDCQTFISKLNELTGKRFRLPTEAEWEFAARGGNKSQHTQYSGSSNIDEVAWYNKNSYDKGESSLDYRTHPVKQKKSNELGIYDMTGNVWEMCQDWYGSYSSIAQTNPTGPNSGSERVCRGGSWFDSARFCRSSVRYSHAPGSRGNNFGLRLALSEL